MSSLIVKPNFEKKQYAPDTGEGRRLAALHLHNFVPNEFLIAVYYGLIRP